MHLTSRFVLFLFVALLTVANTQALPGHSPRADSGMNDVVRREDPSSPSSLRGRQYTLLSKRESKRFRTLQSAPVHGSADSSQSNSQAVDKPEAASLDTSPDVVAKGEPKRRREMSFPQRLKRAKQPVVKDPDSPHASPDPKSKRQIHNADFVSNVEPGPIQPTPAPVPATPAPSAPAPPPPTEASGEGYVPFKTSTEEAKAKGKHSKKGQKTKKEIAKVAKVEKSTTGK